MAYSTSDIKTRALALMGGDAQAPEGLTALCAAAAGQLESRLREGVSAEMIEETFVTAAGMLAIAMYMETACSSGDVSGVRAGNVSVTRRGSGSMRSSAAALRREAECMLSAYLIDRGFSFMGVRG